MKKSDSFEFQKYCQKLTCIAVLQLIAFIIIPLMATIAAFLGAYKHYRIMFLLAIISVVFCSAMLFCACAIRNALSSTPFVFEIKDSDAGDVLRTLNLSPVINGAYYNIRPVGRTTLRLLAILSNEKGVNLKSIKKRANAVINRLSGYEEAQPVLETFKMLRLNIVIAEDRDSLDNAVLNAALFCSQGRNEMILGVIILLQTRQLIIPRIPKGADIHEIQRYKTTTKMLVDVLSH